MHADSDSNRTNSRGADKTGPVHKSVTDRFRDLGRRAASAAGRFTRAADRISDLYKAAAAVLVLAVSLAALFYETKALRAEEQLQTTRQAVTVEAAVQEAAQSAASDAVLDGVSDNLWDARACLESALNSKTASLRREYMEILDRGEGDAFHPKSEQERVLWEKVREQRKKELSKAPYLILVNKWHFLPEDYSVEPVTLPNGQLIGSDCCEPLLQMLEDCREAGGNPIVCSGYRPHDKQVYLYGEQINRWLYSGYGQEESEDLAATAVAIPGTSEHELGLAADIYSSENMSLDESQIYTFTQQWLMENCWRYGFILRYPKDKSHITGIIFEPWHYRYVGKEHARKIHEAGICLEEYLEETEHPQEEQDSGGTDLWN